MGELGNTTEQAAPGTNPPIHLPPLPDPRGASGGAPTPGGGSGPQVPEEHGSAVPDSGRPPKPAFPSPFLPPPRAGGAQNPAAPPPSAPFGDGRDPGQPGYRNPGIPGQPGYVSPYAPSQDVPPAAGGAPSSGSPPSATRSWDTPSQPGQPGGPPSVTPPVIHGGGIGGIDSAGGSRSPYLPDPNNPFPPGVGPNPPFTINPTQGAGPAPGPGPGPGPGSMTPPPEPQLPFVPGYGLRPPGSPSGPPVTYTETHTTPDSGEGSPMAPSGPGFEPVPPSAPGAPGAADEDDSGPRVEIG